MGLQVRLRHALGERLFDLPDRPVEQPLLIGRAREAEVKIPSVTVASQHCAMFIHEGRWVLQDLSGGSTWVNGNPIQGPTQLCIGDVITLGSDATPATVEIDPAGVAEGRTGEPVETEQAAAAPVAAPALAPRPMSRQSMAPRQPSSGAYHASPPRAVPPQMSRPAPVASDRWGASEDSIEGWGQPATAAPTGAAGEYTPPARKRKPQQMSSTGLVIGIAVCLLIVIGTCYAVYNLMHRPAPTVTVIERTSGTKGKADNIFSDGTGSGGAAQNFSAPDSDATSTPKKVHTPVNPYSSAAKPKETETPDPAPSSDTTDTTDAPPKPADDAAWSEVEAASLAPGIGNSILKFDDYRRQHPGAHTLQLDNYVDEAMDRLWWNRITKLCASRTDLNKQIKAKDKDIKEEPSPAFKKTLGDEKKAIEAKLAQVQEHLVSEMGYASEDTPNLDDNDAMAKQKDARDASKYGAWKVSTLKHIRANHGATAWDGE